MISIVKELSCDGVAPTGPCSAWPKKRHDEIMAIVEERARSQGVIVEHAKEVNVSATTMVGGLLKTAGQAIMNGKVSEEIRNERYDTCKACPFFIEDSKRCSECGCFMEAKTWVGGDPNMLCPKQKWSR